MTLDFVMRPKGRLEHAIRLISRNIHTEVRWRGALNVFGYGGTVGFTSICCCILEIERKMHYLCSPALSSRPGKCRIRESPRISKT
jgi:hypothetical protein